MTALLPVTDFPAARSPQITLRNLHKSQSSGPLFQGLDLVFKAGELNVILGPSGCGKSTLLRMIAGLEDVTQGQILMGERDVTRLPPKERGCAMVFQNYALYPHMSVADNIGYPLKMAGIAYKQRMVQIKECATSLGLETLLERKPGELSGGQRQRIALARALAVEPKVLLLDEPFGALDAKVRKELRRWLARLHEDINLTSVFVTHDQEEAMEVADRIVVMNKGVIEQIGSPGEVYENPSNDFVYHFLGDSNRLSLGDEGHVLFRPHEVSLSRQELEDHHAAEVRDIRPLGATTRVTLKVEGQSELIEAEVVKDHDSLVGLARGETLFFKPKVWQKL